MNVVALVALIWFAAVTGFTVALIIAARAMRRDWIRNGWRGPPGPPSPPGPAGQNAAPLTPPPGSGSYAWMLRENMKREGRRRG